MYDEKTGKETAFNLGSHFVYSFDKDKMTLSVNQNQNYVENFYQLPEFQIKQKHIDFSAIVGENGTGKTTILQNIHRIIADYVSKGTFPKNETFKFFILRDSGNSVHLEAFWEDYWNKLSFKSTDFNFFNQSIKTEKEYTRLFLYNFNKNTNSIELKNGDADIKNVASDVDSFYISNVFDAKPFFGNNDYTTNGRLKNFTTESSANTFQYFVLNELKAQIKLIQLFKKHDLTRYIRLPKILKIQLNSDFYFKLTYGKEYRDKLNKFLVNVKSNQTDVYAMYLNIIDVICTITEEIGVKYIEDYKNVINNLITECTDIEEYIEHFFKKAIAESSKRSKNILLKNPEIKNELLSFKKDLLFYSSFIRENTLEKFGTTILIDNIQNTQDELFNYLTKIATPSKKLQLFNIGWDGYSSGEFAILTLLARVLECLEKASEQPSNLLLLIDEAELYFHPQWQKNFVWILNNILELITEKLDSWNKKTYLQVIFTTHSPFLLSDIPSDRVLFLQFEDVGNHVISSDKLEDLPMTFGSNIHDLYAHSFFLKGGLMGEFAKQKINHMANQLIQYVPTQSKELNWDKLLKEINLIGEPILRKRLFELYHEKKPNVEHTLTKNRLGDLELKLEQIQKEIDALRIEDGGTNDSTEN